MNAEEAFADGKPKMYAAVFRDNAAVRFKIGGLGIRGLEREDRPLVVYNVYRRDVYGKMEQDGMLPESVKDLVREMAESNLYPASHEFVSPNLNGWGVVRTEKPVDGEALIDLISDVGTILAQPFFDKRVGGRVAFRDLLILEEFYTI